jgi:hypothetical protein
LLIKPLPSIPPNSIPASPPIISPFIKLPPLKNPGFDVVAVPDFVVPAVVPEELLLTLSDDLEGDCVKLCFGDLKLPPLGLASADPALTAKKSAKATNNNNPFFISVSPPEKMH